MIKIREVSNVFYLGAPGSYSYQVAKKIKQNFGTVETNLVPISTINNLFKTSEVSNQLLDKDYLIIPFENSIAGDVTDTMYGLYENNIEVVTIIEQAIEHHLIALEASNFETIKRVYSHPHALSQVSDFLQKHGLSSHTTYSTVAAAKQILEFDELENGVIGSSDLTLEHPKLKIIKSNIANEQENTTKFIVGQAKISKVSTQNNEVSTKTMQSTRDKKPKFFCLFDLHQNGVGGLVNALELFAAYDIDLTNIRSFPIKGKKFEYFFIVEGRCQTLVTMKIQAELKSKLKQVVNDFQMNFYE